MIRLCRACQSGRPGIRPSAKPLLHKRIAWELAEEIAIPSGHAAELADPPLIGNQRDGAGPLFVAGEVVPDAVQPQAHDVDLRRVAKDLCKDSKQCPA